MNNNSFLERLDREILILDGSIGVLIREFGLKPGEPPENLILRKPDSVLEVHRRYIEAGADILLTNTFGATRLRLDESQIGDSLDEINRQGVKLARAAGGGKALVGLSLGPLGKFLRPIGDLEFRDALDLYRAQVKAAIEEGPDVVVIETISDLREFKAAIIAVKSESDLPVVAHMTFTEDGRTVTGTDPATCVSVASALGVDVVGANCSVGPAELLPVMKQMVEISTLPLSVEPNAGLPRLEKGVEHYPAGPEEMADHALKFVDMGVRMVGACCGSTPDHIRAIRNKVHGKKPSTDRVDPVTTLAGRSLTVRISDTAPIVLIGERINPSGRKDLTKAIEKRETPFLRKEGMEQVKYGAALLDVNMGIADRDPVGTMIWALQTLQQAVHVPLIVDSSDPAVVEAGLMEIEGKSMINSVSGERDSMESLIPLAVKYGAAILGITLDEDGIPESVEERIKIAERIIEFALSKGVALENIVIDPLSLPVSAEQTKVLESLNALRLIKEELGVKTVMGVSNVSFGLPERKVINTTFLSMALKMGLDLPIVNPLDESIRDVIHAADLLLGRDAGGKKYIKIYGTQVKGVQTSSKPVGELSVEESIVNSILEGDREGIDKLIERAMEDGLTPQEITDKCLITGMEEVGDLFEKKIYFLPQVILSAETMQRGFRKVRPFLESGRGEGRSGKILFATVKGDIHDIGKNICITLLENHGFEVVDLGKNVETKMIVERAQREDVDIVALSALMTTTMVKMGEVVEELKASGVTARTMVGGAVVTREYAHEIGADAYGSNAVMAVREAKELARQEERKE